MARTNSLANFLTDVANAIRTKKGTESTIAASAFDTEILNLPSGTYQTKNITISANGSQTITPDTGYDAIDEITITTQVPQKQLQSKAYNFNTNQTIELTPDTGYDGFDIVTLTINVPGQQINNQDKTITQNGQYTADEGYTGLGEVTVNVPSQINNQDKTITENGQYTADSGYTGLGQVDVNVPVPVKLFETKQAMQADPHKVEDDLAIVYADNTSDWDGSSAITELTFPNTVTFTTAISSRYSVYGSSQSGYGQIDGNISSSSATFTIYTDTNHFRIRYSSSDGLTYNRTDGGSETLSLFSTPTSFDMWEWNSIAGHFMQMGSKAFEGLFSVQSSALANLYNTLVTIASTSALAEYETQSWMDFINLYTEYPITHIPGSGNSWICYMLVCRDKTTKRIELYVSYLDGFSLYYLSNGEVHLRNRATTSSASSFPNTIATVKYNVDGTYTYTNYSPVYNTYVTVATDFDNKEIMGQLWSSTDAPWVKDGLVNVSIQNISVIKEDASSSYATDFKNIPTLMYLPAPTQLTLTSPEDIWEDVVAYGKNGVVTGDGSIEDKLDVRNLIKNTSGIDLIKSGELVSTKYHNIPKGSTISLTNKQSFDYASGVATIENLDNKIPSATRELLESSNTSINAYNDDYIIVTHWTAQKSMNIVLLDKDWVILDTKTITYGTVPNVANWTYYTKPTFKVVYNDTLNTTFIVFDRYDNITNSDLSSSRRGAEKITVYKIVNNALSELSTQIVSSNVNYYDKISYDAVPLSSGVGVFIHSYMKSSNNFMCYNFDTSGTVSTKTLSITYVDFNASTGYTGISSWTENTDYAYVLCGNVTGARGIACVKIAKLNGNLTTLDISSYLGQANIQPYLVRGTNTRSYLNSDAGLYKIVDSTITKIADKRNDTLSMTRYDEDSDTGFYQYPGADISGVQIYDRLWYSISERYSDISYSGNSASYTNNYNDGIYNTNLFYFTIGNTRTYARTYVDFTKEISTTKGDYEYIKINSDDVFARIKIDTNIPEDIQIEL